MKGKMKMDNETEIINEVEKWLVRTYIVVTMILVLIGILAVKDIIITTRTTKKLSEVAQKVGVEFQTKTNNVFGVWHIVKPK